MQFFFIKNRYYRLRKIIKIVATRSLCTKFVFGLGRFRWGGDQSASPDPLVQIYGLILKAEKRSEKEKREEGKKKKKDRRGKGKERGKWEGKKGEAPNSHATGGTDTRHN